ncbi:hypothetical protein FOA22_24360 [Heyndrickxia oleronia]
MVGGRVTSSIVAPFSDKLMMYCIYILNGYGIVGNSFATFFSKYLLLWNRRH